MPRTIHYQYRVAWQFVGAKKPMQKVCGNIAGAYKLLLLLTSKTPWHGMGKRRLRCANVLLARQLRVPVSVTFDRPVREAITDYRKNLPKLAWLRVDRRQVMEWTELGDPMRFLKPKSAERRAKAVEAYCDAIDRGEVEKWKPTPREDA